MFAPFKRIFVSILYSGFACLLLLAVLPKLNHTYLEDDLLWLLPVIDHISHTRGLFAAFQVFCLSELTPFNGYYFTLLMSLFDLNLKMYSLFSFVLFLGTGILFYVLLKRRLKLNAWTCLSAALMYLTFFGHFHVYLWPVAAHHLFVMAFILIVLNLYLKTEEIWENKGPWRSFYAWTMFCIFLSSLMRMSILILPLILLGHIVLFREDEEAVLRKLDRWLPGIFLILSGQLLFIILLKLQYILRGLTEPVKQVLNGVPAGWIFFVLMLILIVFRFGVYAVIRLKIFRFIQKGMEFLLLGWCLLPQYLGLCLLLWLRPVRPLQELNPLMRLQIMDFPQTLPALITLFAVTAALMVVFYFYAKERNPTMMIFVIWSMALFFFLDYKPEGVQSRYLIYAMPVLACLVSCLLFELLPQWFKVMERVSVRIMFLGLVMIFGILNIMGIQQRLAQTSLANVIWSYDYIKTANLIADDLKRTERLISRERNLSVCVQNIRPIPYLNDFGFLANYNFHSREAFRMTMKSVMLGENVHWRINEPCEEGDISYEITDRSIVSPAGLNLEPADQLPFVFQLFLDIDQRFWLSRDEKLARAEAMIRPVARPFPGEDAKMVWIKQMLEQELQNYEALKE